MHMKLLEKIARLFIVPGCNLALSLILFAGSPLVIAQSLVFPNPDPSWPHPPQPTLLVPITANTQFVVTGCNNPGRSGTTNITQSTIVNFFPPFLNIHGVGLPGVNFPGANVTSNPFTSTFTLGTYPAVAGSGQGDQFTYSYSQSGSTYSEQLTDLSQYVGGYSDYNTGFDSRILVWTSTYDSSTGLQSVSYNYQISITASNSNGLDAGCSLQETASQTGTSTYTWPVTNMCVVNPADVTVIAGPPYSVSGQPTTMNAEFTPHDANGNPMSVDEVASACGYSGFDWQQQVTALPTPNPFFANLDPRTPLRAPPAFYDPPPGGYTYPSQNSYPFYYIPALEKQLPVVCTGDELEEETYILRMQDCPNDPQLPSGTQIEFTTSLVGVIGPGQAGSAIYKTWIWASTFNGTTDTGGVQLLSMAPLNAASGSGGVRIISIDGASQTPPSVSCSATPNSLWPPNGSTVPITISGQITAGTSTVGVTTFLITDSQSSTQQTGTVTAQSNGGFSFSVPLMASRAGNIKESRQYKIAVTAADAIGNQGSCSALVVVPHDQGN